MDKNDKEQIFEYTYSAPTEKERRVIEDIYRQYSPKKEQTPVERLIYLDKKVKNTASTVALVLGVVGCLVFGLGLAMVLEWRIFFWGITVMAVGAVPLILAYPAYNKALKRGKDKYGQEILKLSENILAKKD